MSGLGHSLARPYAALTPLTGQHPGGAQLAGLSLAAVRLSAHRAPQPAAPQNSGGDSSGEGGGGGGKKGARGGRGGRAAVAVSPRGGFLFTHKGYSGPAVLDISHHAVVALDRGEPRPGGRLCSVGFMYGG